MVARRIDRAYSQLSSDELAHLIGLLGLPADESDLTDVVPLTSAHLIRTAYLAEVIDIAPEALIGRDAELDELTEFCSGPKAYAWWCADAWAGKTALTSWFVTHPPHGLDVVAFFVTGRLVGHADSESFLEVMIEQLTALIPLTDSAVRSTGARKGTWLTLLELAGAHAKERGRGLVVVVDGLDEDEIGSAPLRGHSSIASLLPRHVPPGVHIVVTSRPQPGIPDDVPFGHPLRACRARELRPSDVAADEKRLAGQELRDLLAGDQESVDVVGFITASGGGLTRNDLSELTGRPPHVLDRLLLGVFGRSLSSRALDGSHQEVRAVNKRVYLFTHETLRVTAEEELGSDLAHYRAELDRWVDRFSASGWPDSTPVYCIRGYTRRLIAKGDATRLSALARDTRRHAFLGRVTGTDYAVLSEINAALKILVSYDHPDLGEVAELSVLREIMSRRNNRMPVMLPATWERLGQSEHAEALARAIMEPEARAEAFIALVSAVAHGGDLDRAETLAGTVRHSTGSRSAYGSLVTSIARAGDLDRAEALAKSITGARVQFPKQPSGTAVFQTADPERAEALARSINDIQFHPAVIRALVKSIAEAGDLRRAEALANTIYDHELKPRVLCDLAQAAAQIGDIDRAENLAATITDDDQRGEALLGLVTVIAQAGDLDRAENLAATTTDDHRRGIVLSALSRAVAQAGDVDRAVNLAATITSGYQRGEALAALALAVAQAGDLDRAENLAATITSDRERGEALSNLVTVIAQAGDVDRAENLAATIASDHWRGEALAALGR